MPMDSDISDSRQDEFRWEKYLILLAGLVLVSILHFTTPTGEPLFQAWHIFFRKLYLLPIIAAAIWFGLRGALITAVGACVFYAIHLPLDWPKLYLERMNQIGEMASFMMFAIVAGTLVKLERKAHARVEKVRQAGRREKIRTVVASLSETLGARDPATREHSRRVAELASGFARFLHLPRQEVQDLYLAGILHDIGKIGICDDVLLKPSALTPDERQAVMEHPRIAEKILAPLGFSRVSEYVGTHHENCDGSGYPNGLKQDSIPLAGRILAVADTYDALRFDRPYQSGMTENRRIREIMSGLAGTRLDEAVLRQFWEYMQKGESTCERALTPRTIKKTFRPCQTTTRKGDISRCRISLLKNG